MAKSKGPSAFYSLQKYTRSRQLMGKNGFCLVIDSNGNVTSTNDQTSPHANLQLLSVGPDLVAICGTQAEKYLAVDEKGNLFTTESENKECVFREFLGKNFCSLFRTCHADEEGKSWYLAIDEHGNVTTKNVSISDDPHLHFIVRILKEDQEEEEAATNGHASILHPMESLNVEPIWVKNTNVTLVVSDAEPIWVRQSQERDEGISSYSPSSPSSSGVSASTLSTGDWTGLGDNS